MSQEEVFRVFAACIGFGKEIIAQGDEWRLPGLGKFYCQELPPRVPDESGKLKRSMDAWEDDPKKKIRCKFTTFKSATDAVNEDEESE
jgi:hypothetical protein